MINILAIHSGYIIWPALLEQSLATEILSAPDHECTPAYNTHRFSLATYHKPTTLYVANCHAAVSSKLGALPITIEPHRGLATWLLM